MYPHLSPDMAMTTWQSLPEFAFTLFHRCESMAELTLLNPCLPQMCQSVSVRLRSICLLTGTPGSCVWLLRLLESLSHKALAPAADLQPFFTLFTQVGSGALKREIRGGG